MKIKKISFYLLAPYSEFQEKGVQDMLRYDLAFQFGSIVAFPIFQGQGTKGKPTMERWRSFGLSLSLVAFSTEQCVGDSDSWLTYRHPQKNPPFGPRDYGVLAPVPLTTFLLAKKWEDVV